jgi:hypothetical protein
MKKKTTTTIIIMLAIVTSAVIILIIKNQKTVVELPEKAIYNYLLDYTPIGSDKNMVIEFVKRRGYKIEHEVNVPFKNRSKPFEEYGSNYLRIYLGMYYDTLPEVHEDFIFRCDVVVFWIFNEDNELVHIDVWKVWDGT